MYATQEIAMPTTVVLPDALMKKMQTVAVPFQDTPLTVLERAVEALIEKTNGAGGHVATTPATASDGKVVYPADAPPNLRFTKPLSITLQGDSLPKNHLYWNPLLIAAVRLAAKKIEKQALWQAILVNKKDGKHEDNGYHYIEGADLSVQGCESKGAWKATVHVAKAAGLSVDVTFQWGDDEGAAHPGQVARMTYTPT